MKISALIGPALDWAVAKALGHKIVDDYQYTKETFFSGYWELCSTHWRPLAKYSTSWEQGGPIIEREGVNVCIQNDEPGHKINPTHRWYAQLDRRCHTEYGPTPLIAAMRCYVASKIGNEINIPKELA